MPIRHAVRKLSRYPAAHKPIMKTSFSALFLIGAPFLAVLALIACGSDGHQKEGNQRRNTRFAGSEENHRATLAKNPDDIDAHHNLGLLYLERRKFSMAEEEFGEIVRIVPRDAEGHYYLGVAYTRRHKYDEARDAFETVIRLDPRFVQAYANLGLLHNMKQDQDEEAIAAARRAVEVDSRFAYGHFVLGFIYGSRGQDDQARDAFKKAIQCDSTLAQAYYHLGVIFLRQGDRERALENFERTAALQPDFPEVRYSLGTLYARMGRREEGEQQIELFKQQSAAEMDEEQCKRILYKEGVQSTHVEKVAAHYNLGLLYARKNRSGEALAHFREATVLDSTYSPALLNMGVIQVRNQQQWEEAEKSFQAAVRMQPDYPVALCNLAHLHLLQKRYAVAETTYLKVLQLHPDHQQARYGLAGAYAAQGRMEEARRELNALQDAAGESTHAAP